MSLIRYREYIFSDTLVGIDACALKSQNSASQIDVMRDWFHQNYETPEENTPYDSGEGGYIYIWGGPYDPKEELEKEFADIIPSATIDKLAEELSAITSDWSGKPGRGDLIDYFINEIAGIHAYDNYRNAIRDITRLMETRVDPDVRFSFNRLLYANIITALESFLSDAFITTVLDEPAAMRKFIETTPEYRKEKISISEIFNQLGAIKEKAAKYLGDIIWYNLPKARVMYKDTLGIIFSPNLKDLIDAITIRHDIVHRNGKTKSGKEHMISIDDLSPLLRSVDRLVLSINTDLGARKIRLEETSKKQI